MVVGGDKNERNITVNRIYICCMCWLRCALVRWDRGSLSECIYTMENNRMVKMTHEHKCWEALMARIAELNSYAGNRAEMKKFFAIVEEVERKVKDEI